MNREEYIRNMKEIKKTEFLNWEEDRKAWDFGYALWKTTDEYLQSVYADEEAYDNLSQAELADKVFAELNQAGLLTYFLTDKFRQRIIQYHARNISTTDAVLSILQSESYEKLTPFYFFKYSDVCGFDNIKKFLVSRLSYLKPNNVRFPHKKYGEYWKQVRSEYLAVIKDIPLTQTEEQLQSLSEHYQELEKHFREAQSGIDQERFHKCMMRTMAAIHMLTRHRSIEVDQMPELDQERRKTLPPPDETQILEIPAQDVTPVSS